ncbi:DUF1275 family protein [Sphingobium abikonense]|uniref:DUF1275 family protein n=1 Tax=Sphingobium abikonense TaxID=86193 RepID=UPI0012ECE633|nr:DUF1275 family protein [Sphingobium abikonense]
MFLSSADLARTSLAVSAVDPGAVDFVAVDVETACGRVSSICQIGIVGFRGGAIAFEYETLIDPKDDFSSFNTRIHGITADHVAGMVGALLAERLGKSLSAGPLRRWLLTAAAIETALLWGAAAIALGFDVVGQSPRWAVYAIIAATSIAMGFRNATIRQLKVPDLTTTVLTLTVTGIAADYTLAGGANPNWARRIGSVLSILGGAVLGALLVVRAGSLVVALVLAGALVLVGTALCALHPSALRPAGR